jgi:hypothetical protein
MVEIRNGQHINLASGKPTEIDGVRGTILVARAALAQSRPKSSNFYYLYSARWESLIELGGDAMTSHGLRQCESDWRG